MTDSQFEKAVETYGDMIFRVAYSYLKNRPDAEDVMQETLLKLYQEDSRFESEEHRKRWLIRVAVNQCKSTLRSTWLRRTVPLEEQTDTPVFDRPEQRELFDQVMALPKTTGWWCISTTTRDIRPGRSRSSRTGICPRYRPGSCGPGDSCNDH